MRMRIKVLLGITLVTAAVGVGIVASSGSGASRSQALASAQQTAEDRYLGEHGVKRDDLTQSHLTKSGLSVGIADGKNGTKCIAIATRNSACVSPQAISSGHGLSISAECNPANKTSLEEIAGLVPTAVAKVELALSDGATRTAAVADGSFVFEGPVTGKTDPYPTTLKWVDRSGSVVHTQTFPALSDCNGDIPDGARLSPSQRARLQAIEDTDKASSRAAAVRQGLAPKP